MASIIDKFNSSVIGTYDGVIDYNCVIAPTGDFTRLTGTTAILNSWITILKTPVVHMIMTRNSDVISINKYLNHKINILKNELSLLLENSYLNLKIELLLKK